MLAVHAALAEPRLALAGATDALLDEVQGAAVAAFDVHPAEIVPSCQRLACSAQLHVGQLLQQVHGWRPTPPAAVQRRCKALPRLLPPLLDSACSCCLLALLLLLPPLLLSYMALLPRARLKAAPRMLLLRKLLAGFLARRPRRHVFCRGRSARRTPSGPLLLCAKLCILRWWGGTLHSVRSARECLGAAGRGKAVAAGSRQVAAGPVSGRPRQQKA